MKLYNISISNKCNLKCTYCYTEIKKNSIYFKPKSIKEYKKEIFKLKKQGTKKLKMMVWV
jgi:MoaA/NifB/PqqE/SkfB family radical SAM enzyme